MIDRLIARVFATRNAAHLAHWRTRSYATHMALGSFYAGIIDKLDAIVEAHQGARRILISVNFQAPVPNPDSILDHIIAEADWIAQNRAAIAGDVPSVLNMLDDLHGIYVAAIYKLKFLA